MRPPSMKLPRFVHNWLTYVGATIAILALILFVFLFVLQTLTDAAKAPYAGLVIFVVGSLLLLFLSAFSGYKAYQETDSVAFCGTLCHSVMAPEHTTYLNSPHARVRCVDCHVGPGADWFVRSKMSGAYQVYAVLLNKYPRPIPA